MFFFARLWRRSGVMTDLEFYELRYSGKAASVVRGFRAVYLGLFFNCFIMAMVKLAACKIANILFGLPPWQTILVCGVAQRRLRGALRALGRARHRHGAVLHQDDGGHRRGVLRAEGGRAAHRRRRQRARRPSQAGEHARLAAGQLPAGIAAGAVADRRHAASRSSTCMPNFAMSELALMIFIMPIAIGWWANWYPGAEPGGGSYIAQRMLASKSEKDSLGGTLFFNLAHYVLRPWPWIITALCSIIIFPELKDIQAAFPAADPSLIGHDIAFPAMLKFLPVGFVGLMVGGLIAANSSTILTHLNWGSSYLVHDFYRRFIKPGRDREALRDGRPCLHGRALRARRAAQPRRSTRRRRRSTS